MAAHRDSRPRAALLPKVEPLPERNYRRGRWATGPVPPGSRGTRRSRRGAEARKRKNKTLAPGRGFGGVLSGGRNVGPWRHGGHRKGGHGPAGRRRGHNPIAGSTGKPERRSSRRQGVSHTTGTRRTVGGPGSGILGRGSGHPKWTAILRSTNRTDARLGKSVWISSPAAES